MDACNSRRGRLTRWLALAAVPLWLVACAPLPPVAPAPDDLSTCTVPIGSGDGDGLTQPCPGEAPPPKPRKPRVPKPAPAPAPASSLYDLSPPRESDQQGLASWYGPRFHGRLTASGERFDSQDLTAAHRTLAFGTRVCVRSAVTGKAVVVRINDRGPFTPGRVIDLSHGAAKELGMVGLGIKPVELWRLEKGEEECPEVMEGDEGASSVAGTAPAPQAERSAHATPRKKAVAKKQRKR